jgi:cell shape-determining protein MreC
MKMNYLHGNGYNFSQIKRQVGWKKPTIIVLVVLGLYLWGSAMFVDVSSFFVYPFLRLSGQTDQSFLDSLRGQKELLAENKKLKMDNENLRVKLLGLDNLRVENDKLRGLRGDSIFDPNLILGRVIAKPNHLPYDEIIIDLGQGEIPGLKIGQLVFADREVILGQVDAVANRYTKIKLYSTGGAKIPVVVGEASSPSIAEGMGAGNFSLTLPRGVGIKVGDQVKTSIVGNYILGYVDTIYKDPNDPFQKISFRSPYNIFELAWVQLLR